jgi:hypothetical protein
LFYQALELWHKGPYTNKIDVLSFALVLYEILVGDHGNSRKNPRALADGVRGALPGEMLPEMKSMISRCWAQDPDDRPSFPAVLMELKQIEFKILPGVDSAAVGSFLEGISRKQMRRKTLPKFTRKAAIAGLMESAVQPRLAGRAELGPWARGKKR